MTSRYLVGICVDAHLPLKVLQQVLVGQLAAVRVHDHGLRHAEAVHRQRLLVDEQPEIQVLEVEVVAAEMGHIHQQTKRICGVDYPLAYRAELPLEPMLAVQVGVLAEDILQRVAVDQHHLQVPEVGVEYRRGYHAALHLVQVAVHDPYDLPVPAGGHLVHHAYDVALRMGRKDLHVPGVGELGV
jgi:hypothetical protein